MSEGYIFVRFRRLLVGWFSLNADVIEHFCSPYDLNYWRPLAEHWQDLIIVSLDNWELFAMVGIYHFNTHVYLNCIILILVPGLNKMPMGQNRTIWGYWGIEQRSKLGLFVFRWWWHPIWHQPWFFQQQSMLRSRWGINKWFNILKLRWVLLWWIPGNEQW